MSNFFLYVLMPWQWSWWCSPTKRNIVKVCKLSDYVKFVQCSLFQIWQEITLGWQFHVPFCLVRSLSEILQKGCPIFFLYVNVLTMILMGLFNQKKYCWGVKPQWLHLRPYDPDSQCINYLWAGYGWTRGYDHDI